MSTPFRFKQFSIHHDRCAHKVGTDGVLLGAWVNADNPKHILDVGTGSGLIALMLAQRFPEATITGIEVDSASVEQAGQNAVASPFAGRVKILQGDFLSHPFEQHFDLIVSNPPFFMGNTSSGSAERNRARHEEALPQKDFIQRAIQLLSPSGKLAVVLPSEEGQLFTDKAIAAGLFLDRLTKVAGSPKAPVKRWLMEFGKQEVKTDQAELILRDMDGQFSESYKTLSSDFYLNF